MKTVWRAAAVAMILACGPAAAADLATPAVVKRNVNVRGGPNTTYPVVGQLQNGQPIEVLGCARAWCQLAWPGQAYVSAGYLEIVGVVTAPPPVPVAPAIIIAPPVAPLVYAAPAPVLYYPPPPRYYGPPPAPGPISGGVSTWGW